MVFAIGTKKNAKRRSSKSGCSELPPPPIMSAGSQTAGHQRVRHLLPINSEKSIRVLFPFLLWTQRKSTEKVTIAVPQTL